MRILVAILILALIGTGIGLGYSRLSKNTSTASNIPDELTYSPQTGWKQLAVSGATVDLNPSWGLQPASWNAGVFSNNKQSKDMMVGQLQADKTKSIIDYYSMTKDPTSASPDQVKQYAAAQQSMETILQAKWVKINGLQGFIIIKKVNNSPMNTVGVVAGVEKNGTSYILAINTTEENYNSTQADILKSVASLRVN